MWWQAAAGGVVPVSPYGYAQHALAPLAVARPYAVPAVARVAPVAPVDEYDPNPQYSYAYDIQDALTGKYVQQQHDRCIVVDILDLY